MTRRLAPLLLTAALGACCTPLRQDLIVVLPAADGHVGGVVVEAAGAQITLDKPYAGAKPGAAGAMAPVQSNEEEVGRIFKDALAARPIPPKTYTLYFITGSNELVPESRADMEAMLAEIGERKAAEVVITGHTDTVGSGPANDRLSLDRAKAVELSLRDTLAAKGVKSDAVTTAGRGERAPLIKTPDQTPEPKNRRVEITVR